MRLFRSLVGVDQAAGDLAAIESQFKVAKCMPSDCDSCTTKYPSSLSINTTMPLWGSVKPWRGHILCATGKTDWVKKVTEQSGTLAHAVAQTQSSWNKSGKDAEILASSLAPPEEYFEHDGPDSERPSRLLVLPDFIYINNVTPNSAGGDLTAVMRTLNEERVSLNSLNKSSSINSNGKEKIRLALSPSVFDKIALPKTSLASVTPSNNLAHVLLCSHRTRDKRCAITAKILKELFEQELSERDLYRDASDERAGGVHIHQVSHVGGHKYAANVIIYTRHGQTIWLARVKPEHVKLIVRHCILEGEVLPELLRGGFNSNAISW